MSSVAVKITLKKNETVNVFVYDSDYKKALAKGTLDYWIRGIGHKKTKKFELIAELPERWAGSDMSWMQVAAYTDQYGLNIGEGYADCKTAGIIARQTAAGYCEIYKKCKHLLKPEHEKFFAMLRCDYMLSCVGVYLLDIIRLDEALAEADGEYNHSEATHQGSSISMSDYVKVKFGQEYVDIINACTEHTLEERQILNPTIERKNGELPVNRERIAQFIRENYLKSNLAELLEDEFFNEQEDFDLAQIAADTIKTIESQTLQLEL
jgi:hypothetical protein